MVSSKKKPASNAKDIRASAFFPRTYFQHSSSMLVLTYAQWVRKLGQMEADTDDQLRPVVKDKAGAWVPARRFTVSCGVANFTVFAADHADAAVRVLPMLGFKASPGLTAHRLSDLYQEYQAAHINSGVLTVVGPAFSVSDRV